MSLSCAACSIKAVRSSNNLVPFMTKPRTRHSLIAFFIALTAISIPLIRLARTRPRSIPSGDATAAWQHWADVETCESCHDEIVTAFRKTGHARTMVRAEIGESPNPLLQQQVIDDGSSTLRFEPAPHGIDAICRRNGGAEQRVRLTWRLGSGEHAMTWIAPLLDGWGQTELLEFRWTWFRETQAFGLTPGQSERPKDGYFARLGVLYEHGGAWRCIQCHATRTPRTGGRIDFEAVRPGVGCQRCHGPRGAHVAQAQAGAAAVEDPFWSTARAIDAVNRCGECHRRADDQDPASIRPGNIDIVRFQPVGLTQSACFKRSERMTCTTCHDPHASLARQALHSDDRQCTQCHHSTNGKPGSCGAGNETQCLGCHMPKVETWPGLSFTDHWIRIREGKGE